MSKQPKEAMHRSERMRLQGYEPLFESDWETGLHPMDDLLRGERLPHIWCQGCGLGTALTGSRGNPSGRKREMHVVVVMQRQPQLLQRGFGLSFGLVVVGQQQQEFQAGLVSSGLGGGFQQGMQER